MIFPIYVTLERMDRTLIEASKDLGAGRWATFRQITLPIALPGLITGSILVFIPLMGEYIVPAILGYGRVFLIGNQLVLQFLEARNWPVGSAYAVMLILIMIVSIGVLPVVHRPRAAGPRRERPVSAATGIAGRLATARRRGPRSRPDVEPGRGLAARPHDPDLHLPVHPDHHRRPVQLQRDRSAGDELAGVQPEVVRPGAGRPADPERPVQQPDHRDRAPPSSRRSSGRWPPSGCSGRRAGSGARSPG